MVKNELSFSRPAPDTDASESTLKFAVIGGRGGLRVGGGLRAPVLELQSRPPRNSEYRVVDISHACSLFTNRLLYIF